MPPTLVNTLAAGLTIIVIVAFALLYGNAMRVAWFSRQPPTEFPKPYVYVATILAGLVGGVAAMLFNESLPKEATAQSAPPPAKGTEGLQPRAKPATGPEAGLKALARLASPSQDSLLSVVAAIYAITYFVIGFAAIGTWVAAKNSPDLVNNLALISLGLFVAIVRSFFHVPNGS
jgi:hypothetical protein